MKDVEFLEAFEAATLGSLRHHDHVRLAWLYLRKHPTLEALTRITGGIRHFAVARGVPGLYHETITWGMMFLIQERMLRRKEGHSFDAFRSANPDLFTWDPPALRRYYSKETLTSPLARRIFLLPDSGNERHSPSCTLT